MDMKKILLVFLFSLYLIPIEAMNNRMLSLYDPLLLAADVVTTQVLDTENHKLMLKKSIENKWDRVSQILFKMLPQFVIDDVFLEYAKKCDIPSLEKILKRGANPNATDKNEQTALHIAVLLNSFKLKSLLLDHLNIKVKPNIRDKKNRMPVNLAFEILLDSENYDDLRKILVMNNLSLSEEELCPKTTMLRTLCFPQLYSKKELNDFILQFISEIVKKEKEFYKILSTKINEYIPGDKDEKELSDLSIDILKIINAYLKHVNPTHVGKDMLFVSVKTENIDAVKLFLNSDVEVASTEYAEKTFLDHARKSNNQEMIQLLESKKRTVYL